MALDSTAAHADELARRWAVAMILARPIERMGELSLQEIAIEAPALCAQVIRALQSDVELDRLTGWGPPSGREHSAQALRFATIAGAPDAVAAVAAVEALRGVLWDVLVEDVRWTAGDRSTPRLLADMADRLAYVCAGLLEVAVAEIAAGSQSVQPDSADVASDSASGLDDRSAARAASSAFAAAPASRAVIVDERAPAEGPGTTRERRVVEYRSAPPGGAEERPLSWDESPPVAPGAPAAEIEIRDERVEDGPGAWISSIGRELERFAREREPFTVMLLEPMDMERLTDAPSELVRVDEELGGALESALGPAPLAASAAGEGRSAYVTREARGRYWVLVPRGDARAARELCDRLVRAAAPITGTRGAPLDLAIGTATCPGDGRDAPALAAHADVDLYASRSAARFSRSRLRPSVDERA